MSLHKVVKKPYEHFMKILILTILLLIIGVMMVYSASYVWADYTYDDHFYFFKRQLFFICIGLICLFVVAMIPYRFWQRHVYLIFIMAILLLIAVLIPGVGLVRGGARSWIGVGMFSIQPAEFIKLALIIFIAHYYTVQKRKNMSLKHFLQPLGIVLIVFALIMLQPDFGTGLVIVLTALCLMFISGLRLLYYVIFSFLGLFGLFGLIASAPYRLKRITSFLDPWQDPLGDGFQIIQSLYAIGPGQLIGVGYLNSMQKYFYLPEPQTDFIFAILSEEFGLIGATVVIILFYLLFREGIIVALKTKDDFGRYVIFGILTMVAIQVIINIFVVIGLLPVTGITLPFLSYGGSSLMITLASIGIVLNISYNISY